MQVEEIKVGRRYMGATGVSLTVLAIMDAHGGHPSAGKR